MRVMTARRLVCGCSQILFIRTPGCRSCHARSLTEMISDNGDFVVLMGQTSVERLESTFSARESSSRRGTGQRGGAPGCAAALLGLELHVLVGRREGVTGDEPEPR